MPRQRRRRANWAYRWSLLATVGVVAAYIAVQTVVRGMAYQRPGLGIDWQLALVSSLLDATCALWFAAVGASIGSFLNVVAYRLPLNRSIGGHSACPYCASAIAGQDNVPVFAWIKLRGRCRNCRLPISIQYPLVELGVGLVFLVVYFSEFATGGGNLPGPRLVTNSSSWLSVGVTLPFATRIAVYLLVLSGLLAAALIAIKRRIVPPRLYLWSLLPIILSALVDPDILIVRWRVAEPVGPVEARLDALTTIVCGLVTGVALARLIAPLIYRGFDRSLMASDPATAGARQFMGALGTAAASVGWQAAIPVSWCVLLVGLLGICLLRRTKLPLANSGLSDLTVWVWLGLLLFRTIWSSYEQWRGEISSGIAPVVGYVIAALLLAMPAILYRRLAQQACSSGKDGRVPNRETAEVKDESGESDAHSDESEDAPAEIRPSKDAEC